MVPLTDKEIESYEEHICKKDAIYATKGFVMTKMKKINLN